MNEYLELVQDDYRLWGFINASGIVIPPQFDDAGWFSEGLAGVKVDNKWGFINRVGEMVVAPQFDSVAGFSEGLASVRIGYQWGAIDTSGNLVIPPQFDLLEYFSEGLAIAHVGGRFEYSKMYGMTVTDRLMMVGGMWGVVDKTGQFVISPRFKSPGSADLENQNPSGEGFKHGILAFYGPSLVYEGTGITPPPEVEEVEPVVLDVDTIQSLWDQGDRKWRKAYISSLTPKEKTGKFGFINYAGDIIIEPMWDKVSNEWQDGLLGVFNNSEEEDIREAYLKPGGEIAFINNSINFRPFYDGMAVAWENDDLSGYLDTNGCLVIDYQFAHAEDFCCGLAAVTYCQDFETALYGYIDKSGQIVIPEQFISAHGFDSNGLAAVEVPGGKYGLIDRKGQFVLSPKYDYLSAMYGYDEDDILYKFFEGEEDNNRGVIDSQGNVIINPIYRHVSYGDGIIEAELEGTRNYEPKIYFNKAGEIIFRNPLAKP